MQAFISELRRRNVLRVAAFYAAAGWLLVQVATQVFPFFDIPNWLVRVVVLAIVLGFVPALLFSWFYELTPQGIKLESEVTRDESITRATGRRLDRWIIAVLGLAVRCCCWPTSCCCTGRPCPPPRPRRATSPSPCCRSRTSPTTRPTPISRTASRTRS